MSAPLVLTELPASRQARRKALRQAAPDLLAALMGPVDPATVLAGSAEVTITVRRGVLKQALLWEAAMAGLAPIEGEAA